MNEPQDVVSLLVQQYVAPATHIAYDAALVTTPLAFSDVTSLKFRGEESAWSILRHLGVVARDAAWGVNENGAFFFLRKCSGAGATYRIDRDLIRLEESRERDLLYNRLLLTGGYVYGPPDPDDDCRCVYRWRGNYLQPASRAQYGERAIRVWVPWVRTAEDSREFAREFFRVYADPATRWWLEAGDQSTLPRPWLARIRLEDRHGDEIVTAFVDTIRVLFDHRPRLRMIVGPADPRERWPEPAQHERYPLPPVPVSGYGGDLVTLGTAGAELTESCSDEDTTGTGEG